MSAITNDLTTGLQAHSNVPGVKGVGIIEVDFTKTPIVVANGDTNTIKIAKVNAGTIVTSVKTIVLTAEGDAVTGEIGDGDDIDGWVDAATAAFNLNATAGTFLSGNGAFATALGKYYAADDTIDLVIANSSGGAYTLNTGKFRVYVEYCLK